MKPMFVTPEGRVVTADDATTPVNEVEHQEDPLHVVAARSAAKQSIKVKETK